MKLLAMLGVFGVAVFGQYAGPRTVYILPMSAGLDQYVAQALTRGHVMRVVTDPKAAEVVMTDNVGEPFEAKLKEILPAHDTDKDKKADDSFHNTFRSSRTRGTIFLVDAKSRQVLWSDYQEPPHTNSSHDLNRAAEGIVKKLSSK